MCVCQGVCSCHLAEGGVTMGGAHHKKVHNVQLYPHTCTRFCGKVGDEPEETTGNLSLQSW